MVTENVTETTQKNTVQLVWSGVVEIAFSTERELLALDVWPRDVTEMGGDSTLSEMTGDVLDGANQRQNL